MCDVSLNKNWLNPIEVSSYNLKKYRFLVVVANKLHNENFLKFLHKNGKKGDCCLCIYLIFASFVVVASAPFNSCKKGHNFEIWVINVCCASDRFGSENFKVSLKLELLHLNGWYLWSNLNSYTSILGWIVCAVQVCV